MMIRALLSLLLLAGLALPAQAQKQPLSPADWQAFRVKSARYDSLLLEHADLKRYAVSQQYQIDQLRVDLSTSNAGNAELRRCLFGEIDYNQNLELSIIIQKKERARLDRHQRKRNAKLGRQYERRLRAERKARFPS